MKQSTIVNGQDAEDDQSGRHFRLHDGSIDVSDQTTEKRDTLMRRSECPEKRRRRGIWNSRSDCAMIGRSRALSTQRFLTRSDSRRFDASTRPPLREIQFANRLRDIDRGALAA